MARGRWIAGALLVVAVAAGVFTLWRAPKSTTSIVASGVSPDAAQVGTPQGSSFPTSSAAVALRSQQASPDPSRDANSPAQIGLKPLTIEQERRLDDFLESEGKDNADVRDYEVLVANEAPDDEWSDTTKVRLEEAIGRHGARFTALHASAPYCTRTVCRVLATGGFDSDAPDADWQRLIGEVLRDPALRGAFTNDQHTMVGGDGKGVMFVTYLFRRSDDAR